jgi:tetratricopeptide (TPR) repeat protein
VQVLYFAYPRQSPLGKPIPNWPACQQYTTHVLRLLSLYETENKVREKADTNTLTLLTELLCDCGVYLWARCLFGDAERLARASIEIAERVLEPHDCLRAQPYTLLGCICLRSDSRKDEAVKSLELALHIRDENMQTEYKHVEPPLHVDIQLANAYSNLGIAAKQTGEFEKASKLHKKAISIKERQRDHCAGFLLGLSLHNVGKLRHLQGHVEEAVEFFSECIAEMSIYRGDEEMKARQAVWVCSLAEAEASLGREEEAEAHFTESLQTLEKVMKGSLDTGTTCLRFGAFRYGAGRFEEAL